MSAKPQVDGYTPGPWTQADTSRMGQITVWAGPRHLGANAPGVKCIRQAPGFVQNFDEEIANARLIAAAPELVETLKHILDLAEENTKTIDGYGLIVEWARKSLKSAGVKL